MAGLPASAFVPGFDDEPTLAKLIEWRFMLESDQLRIARGVTKEQCLVWLNTEIDRKMRAAPAESP